ncbi:hypothetical protein FQN57_000546 [Myotisia sp. PD_48]|nr:hypothetical protein FQN57_000546 [Myotisia sp. PD_48]
MDSKFVLYVGCLLLGMGFYSCVFVTAAITATPEACCALLSRELPGDVFVSNSTTWQHENSDFWSTLEILEPTCVFLPNSTEKVSQAVKLFTKHDCKFAIKGGGHSTIPGAASIHDGILVSPSRLKTTQVNFDEGYIRVGSGALLMDVYAALDPHNLSAVIGRYANVGMGLALGAGISFFSNRDGLAIDNIRNYEVVLANGEIVNANAKENHDLLWALKGGNNNFGVVTHFDLDIVKTPGSVYGGQIVYDESSFDQVNDVIYDYHTRQAVEGLLTHAMPQYLYFGNLNTTINATPLVYNSDVDQLPEILQPWLRIPHRFTTLQKRTYTDLSIHLNVGYGDGLVQGQQVFTVYADKQFYRDVWFHYRQWLQKHILVPGFVGSHLNMPITPRQIREGVKKGGNALGLEDDGDKVLGVLFFGVTFFNKADSLSIFAGLTAFVQSMEELARQRGILHRYKMLTYSGANQAAIASYGEKNVRKLYRVQRKYDPTAVFQRLVPGGQKLPPT